MEGLDDVEQFGHFALQPKWLREKIQPLESEKAASCIFSTLRYIRTLEGGDW